MKRALLAFAVVATTAFPALAQSVDAMTCADFAKQDQTERMQTIAAVQSFTSQTQASEQLMSNEIFTQLTTKCTGHDDLMVMDAMK